MNLSDLIDTAKRERKWLHCAYQDLWFSPTQLRAANAQGRFRWGPVNWTLRDPAERVEEAKQRLNAAEAEYEHIVREVMADQEGRCGWMERAQQAEAEVARLQQALETERESHHICTEGQQVMLDQMNRLQQALEVCAVPLEALRLVRERHSLPELSPEIQAAIMQATEVIRAVLADQVSR